MDRVLDDPRPRDGDAAVVDTQRLRYRPFVPTTLQVGASLYDGLNPKATGASNMEEFVPRFTAAEERRAAAAGGNRQEPLELRLDRRMRDAALAWAWANPGRALQLAGVKFLRMWNVWPNEPRLAELADRFGGVFHVYPVADFCHNWRLANTRPGLAVCTVLAAGRVPDVVARGVCQFAPVPRAGDASIAGAGRGRNRIGIGDWGLGIRDEIRDKG